MDQVTARSYDRASLDAVFGPRSRGETPDERARTSTREFVRSQVQIAPASDGATGRRLTSQEALATFGWDILLRAVEDGSYVLVTEVDEPAATLRARRKQEMRLSTSQIARQIDLPEDVVRRAETPGKLSPIRHLEMIAQALALDERVIGYVPKAHGDRGLGVRLRELSEMKDARRLPPQAVVGLAEAAWVISRQASLATSAGIRPDPLVEGTSLRDWNYGYPTWEVGFRLAAKTRGMLGLRSDEPITSVRSLIEEKLGIPLIQQSLDERFAGATLANGATRGIVVNERGMNENVWVRRMTLCHELGHLLWDPDQRLSKLTVDEYSGIDDDYGSARPDPVEIRANAFAVAFLAPPEAVKEIAQSAADTKSALDKLMQRFGISATAAKYHMHNVAGLDTSVISNRDLPQRFDEWIGQENLAIDYFPIRSTPITRRGRFAWHVVTSFQAGRISGDTAAMALRCTEKELSSQAGLILSALTPHP